MDSTSLSGEGDQELYCDKSSLVFYTLVFVIAIILTLITRFWQQPAEELSKHLPFLDKLVSMIISMRVTITPWPVCGVPVFV